MAEKPYERIVPHEESQDMKKPNVVLVFSDQHRAEATGFMGNPDVKTPFMDALAKQSVVFQTAVSGCPVCSPYRASLITGQYPTTHGVFMNDVQLNTTAVSIADAYKSAGYATAYIGKWHLDGQYTRRDFIPEERRQGFEYWRVLECTHDYFDSGYYGDSPELLTWEGYDAEAQTRCALQYIRDRDPGRPFLLLLSWGPPHDPFHMVPERYKRLYSEEELHLRPNTTEQYRVGSGLASTRTNLTGYYGHITALDEYLGAIAAALEDEGIADDTILVYTSDHGEMLGAHEIGQKSVPYDESILVPLFLRYPSQFSKRRMPVTRPISAVDIMPTLLGLCGIEVPATVEGINFAPFLRGEVDIESPPALLMFVHPFGLWEKRHGGREYRGLRTERYTYVRDLYGPWLLFDNLRDPYQQINKCHFHEYRSLRDELDAALDRLLVAIGDQFEEGSRYVARWNYTVDENGTVPIEINDALRERKPVRF